jgi:TolB-like protein
LKKENILLPINSLSFSLIFFVLLYLPLNAAAIEHKTIAILPFEINAPDDLPHIRQGIESMLYSRLYWKNKIAVIDTKTVSHKIKNRQIKKQKAKGKNPLAEQVAEYLNCDYIMTGYITHFSNAFSIDIRVYDRQNKQWTTFFEQAISTDLLINKINIISAKINKSLFNREGIVYGKLIKKEKQRAEQWKLQNPMEMMPVVPDKDKEKKKSSFWKFWE